MENEEEVEAQIMKSQSVTCGYAACKNRLTYNRFRLLRLAKSDDDVGMRNSILFAAKREKKTRSKVRFTILMASWWRQGESESFGQ